LKARVLAHHHLFRPALFYRCRDLLEQAGAADVLQDVNGLLGQVRAAERGELPPYQPVPEGPEEVAIPQDLPEGVEADSSGSFDLPTMDGLSGLDALRVAEAVERGASNPSTRPLEGAVVEVPVSASMSEALALFEDGQACSGAGDLVASAAAFQELLGSGDTVREFYYSRVCSEVRTLLWQFLLRSGPSDRAGIRALWGLAVSSRLETLLPICEYLLAVTYADSKDDDQTLEEVEGMVTLRPESFLVRQLAADKALALGNEQRWAEHLVAAAEARLEKLDLITAARLLMAARGTATTPEIEAAHARMLGLGEQVAGASEALAKLLERLEREEDPSRAYIATTELAESFPSHEPTLEELARRARTAGFGSRASDVLMALGRVRLLREDLTGARASFRQVLETEFENDEALIYLTSLRGIDELFDAGIHRALQALNGSERDVALREQLIGMCKGAGRDPSRHRVGLAILLLGKGDREGCRELCELAFEESDTPWQLVEVLVRVPNINSVYTRVELAQRRS
jgi:tetratricopeptide (TPR) repeat protein